MKHYLYIIYSSAIDKYYVGVSANPWHRIEQHNTNSIEKYTGKTHDWEMKAVFFVSEELSEALKIEKFIKKQKSRKLIERLINSADIVFDGALSQLVIPYVRDACAGLIMGSLPARAGQERELSPTGRWGFFIYLP